MFWSTKWKADGKTNDSDYPTFMKTSGIIRNQKEARENIADSFANLYQARECRAEYTKWGEEIRELVRMLVIYNELTKKAQGITVEEVKGAVKRLKQ